MGCVYFHDTESYAVPNRADYGKLGKFGATFRHGTVFAPTPKFIRKGSYGMENLKM